MVLGIIFAIGAMVLTGVGDFLYKFYTGGGASRGIFIAVNGIFYLITFIFIGQFILHDLVFSNAAIVYGIICGIITGITQLLFISGLTKVDGGVGSTIYRLNFVYVVVFALLFLGETITVTRFVGIAFAVFAIFILSEAERKRNSTLHLALVSILLLVLASIMKAASSVIFKVAMNEKISISAFQIVMAGCWIPIGFLFAAFREKNRQFTQKWFALSMIQGIKIGLLYLCVLLAMRYVDAVVVVPITQMAFMVAVVLSVMFLKEKLNVKKVAGIATAVLAVVFLSL